MFKKRRLKCGCLVLVDHMGPVSVLSPCVSYPTEADANIDLAEFDMDKWRKQRAARLEWTRKYKARRRLAKVT